jgi:sugar lactone lactonase YvrE
MTPRVTRVGDLRCTVGEGPVWDVAEQVLYFVDLVGRRVWRHDPRDGAFDGWDMPQTTAAVTTAADGELVAVLADGLHTVDRATGAVTPRSLVALREATQLNDAKVDRGGRLVAGAAHGAMTEPRAAVYGFGPDGVAELDDGYVLCNGPCWSADGATFYLADSIPHDIYAYDYDPTTGEVADRRVFANTRDLGGIPDGATVDAAGRLWSAICGGGKVVAFAPDGTVETVVDMPTAWVSSVMFGGADLDTLYVTSLDPTVVGIDPDDGAGYLYAVEGLGVTGLPERPLSAPA